jgi:GT2 family glycosyltransferase
MKDDFEGTPPGCSCPIRPLDSGLDVSVVLACFDQTRELDLSLLSFLRQDFPEERYELIVVDDHSPDDGARGIVGALRRRHPNASIHLVRQYRQDGGRYSSSARVKNLGVRLARGRYVWFNNAEIVQAGESLAHVVRRHDEASGPLCLRGRVIDLGFEELWDRSQAELEAIHDRTDRARERVATADHAGLASMRRDIFLAVGGIDERFDHWGKEDLDLAARLKRAGVSYRYDEDVKSFHVSHPANHVKGADYGRMCRLLEDNNERQVIEVNRGQLWGELGRCPAAQIQGTVVVAADGRLAHLERRLETLLYGPGGDEIEVLVASLERHRQAVEDLLERRFLGLPIVALAGDACRSDADRVLARIRTPRLAIWLPHGADPRPRWSPRPAVFAELTEWLAGVAKAEGILETAAPAAGLVTT